MKVTEARPRLSPRRGGLSTCHGLSIRRMALRRYVATQPSIGRWRQLAIAKLCLGTRQQRDSPRHSYVTRQSRVARRRLRCAQLAPGISRLIGEFCTRRACLRPTQAASCRLRQVGAHLSGVHPRGSHPPLFTAVCHTRVSVRTLRVRVRAYFFHQLSVASRAEPGFRKTQLHVKQQRTHPAPAHNGRVKERLAASETQGNLHV